LKDLHCAANSHGGSPNISNFNGYTTSSIKVVSEDFGGDHDNQHQGSLLNTGPDMCHNIPYLGEE